MKKIKLQILKKLGIDRFRDLLVDSYSENLNHHTPLFRQIWKTFRYRVAGSGFPITFNEKKLIRFKDVHAGKRAFIIGNGPSLNKCDMRLLKNEFTFGVNAIFLNYEKMGFYPTYYVVEDVFVAEDRAQEINQFKGSQKFFGHYLDYCIQDQPDVIWLNVRMNYRDYPNYPHFSQNAARMIWVGGTVSYICLQLAYFMGFSEVYLIGFDHSYKIPSDVTMEGTNILSKSDDPNHFHPDYFGKGYRWHDPNVERMEKALCRARVEYQNAGRKIFNATVRGNLEVFERVDYGSLFK